MQINDPLYVQLQIIDPRRQYYKLYKENTNVNMLRSKMIQNKIMDENLKQAKDEMKALYMKSFVC